MSQPSSEIFVERCNLHVEHGFSVVALAANNRIGKLCAVRKSDYPRSGKSTASENGVKPGEPSTSQEDATSSAKPSRKDVENAFFVVEFYNVISPPSVFLEKAVPVWDTQLESVTWSGNVACVTCSDGAVLVFSPFTHVFKRYQLCASSIVASAPIRDDRLALGTESGELLIAQYTGGISSDTLSENGADHNARTLRVTQRIKLHVDEQLVCLATSKQNANLLAVGAVNAVLIYDLQRPDQSLRIALEHKNRLVIWSMVFVDKFLFTGDSNGIVTIYNTKNGANLKNMNVHQSAVLAMATDGVSVYTSGVDQRIQVISGIQGKPNSGTRYDWVVYGQRLFHSNDISALAVVGDCWLASGGAEHEIFISDAKAVVATSIPRPSCFRADRGVNESSVFLLRNPHGVQVWHRVDVAAAVREHLTKSCASDGNRLQIDVEQADVRPKKLIQINTSEHTLISQAAIAPSGTFVAFSTDVGLKVYRLNVDLALDSSNATTAGDTLARPKRSRAVTHVAGPALQKYWDSKESDEFAAADDDAMDFDEATRRAPFTVSAMLILSDDLYFAEANFRVWCLSLRPTSRKMHVKVFVERKGAGQIVKLCANPSKNFLVALTTNAQLLKIGAAPADRTDDENAEGTGEEADDNCNAVETIPFNYSAFDCVFVSDNIALFACAQRSAQLVFFDLTAGIALKVISREDLRLGYFQFVSGLSDVRDDRVIIVTNKSKVRVLSRLERAQPLMHIKRKDVRDGPNKKHNCVKELDRSTPFWGVDTAIATPVEDVVMPCQRGSKKKKTALTVAESEQADLRQPPSRTLLLIGHGPLAPPSRAPMRKRGYELN